MPTVRPGQVLPYGPTCGPAPGEVRRSVGLFEAALRRRSPSLPLLSLALLAVCLIAMGLSMTRQVLYAVAVAQRHGAWVEMPNRLIAKPQPGLTPDAGRVRQPDQDKPSSSWGEVTSACGPASHHSRLFQNEKTNRALPPTTSTDEFKASAVRVRPATVYYACGASPGSPQVGSPRPKGEMSPLVVVSR